MKFLFIGVQSFKGAVGSHVCLTNSVYLPRGQACRNQEHLLRQINLVGLNRLRGDRDVGIEIFLPVNSFKLWPRSRQHSKLLRGRWCVAP